tara:strand:- start:206 stop:1429 length:1224 start_codon:yes stop_codon:yes gene_type:complete
MSILLHGDCLDEMKGLDDNSVDLIFCDLPYGQTSCKWDCPIDLDKFWVEVMRIKKLNTPIFMTTTTKFGVSLINSAPKKCPFRWDIVWVKSAAAGFLCAKKMPMRKHEMVYAFYEKLPFYDLSSHQHKFINHKENSGGASTTYGKQKRCVGGKSGEYNPPLPTSIVKEEATINNYKAKRIIYTDENGNKIKKGQSGKEQTKYDPPLPTSIVKEEYNTKEGIIYNGGNPLPINDYSSSGRKGSESAYEPPLPTSIVKEEYNTKEGIIYNGGNPLPINDYSSSGRKGSESAYEPPLPTSIVKEEKKVFKTECETAYGKATHHSYGDTVYDPPLPTSMLEIKSTRGKHSTEKPVALMEWILKYFSKEGDTVLDPTMGSGSTGVACKNMNRNFIGIEMDAEIYEVAVNRIE